MGAAGPICGPELGAYEDGTPFFRVGDWRLDGVPYRESLFMQVGMRLDAMDAAGIRVQALSPNPLSYLHFIPSAGCHSLLQGPQRRSGRDRTRPPGQVPRVCVFAHAGR